MRRFVFIYAVVTIILILVPSLSLAEEKEQKLYTIHPLVGDVIDAEENEKYNLFGPIEGFIAAKFYEYEDMGKQRQYLHIIGETEEGGYIFVRALDIRGRHKLHELGDYLRDFEEKYSGTVPHLQADPFIPFSKDALETVGRILSIKLIDDTELVGSIAHATVDTIFLIDLSIPIPDSMIKEVKVVSSRERFLRKYVILPVSGIGKSGHTKLGGANHLRLWFGPDPEDAIQLCRKSVTWTVLADSLLLTGPHDIHISSETLSRVEVGRKNVWLGAGIGLLAGIGVSYTLFHDFKCDDCSYIAPFLIAAAVTPPVIGGVIGVIIGSRISWNTIYSSLP